VARVDYFNDPKAPKANTIVPSATAAVVDDAGALLLVHKTDNNLWELPGGVSTQVSRFRTLCSAKLGRRRAFESRLTHWSASTPILLLTKRMPEKQRPISNRQILHCQP
jgi:hypothetical protein